MALGRPRMLTVFTLLNVSLFVPLVAWGAIEHGVLGAAWASLAVVLVMVPTSHAVAARVLKLPLLQVLAQVWRPALAAVALFFVVDALVQVLGTNGNALVLLPRLLLAGAAGVSAYIAVLLGLWALSGRPDSAESLVLTELRTRLKRR
jgi:lipopolysaccharide exporter